VFQTKSAGLAEGAKFLIATALSFGANQLVLLIALSLLGREPTMRALAQLTAIATYSTLQYALCKFWVFPVQQPALK
jgi:putative flippase GtrA